MPTIATNEIETAIRLREDPIFFIQEVLGIDYITEEQKKIVLSVFNNRYTGVPSAHNVGKTFIAACIVLAYMIPRPDSIVLTTAPTGRQVKDLLWAEISKMYFASRYPIGGKLTQVRLDMNSKWFAIGIATEIGREEHSAVKFQGYHAKHLLVILDEATGIHPSIWGAIDGITSSKSVSVLAIGNPSVRNSQFFKHCKKKDWNEIEISALTHPNIILEKEVVPGGVSVTWIEEKIRDWCSPVKHHIPGEHTFEWKSRIYKPNDLFLWKCLGKFPRSDSDGICSFDDVEFAMNNETMKYKKHRHLGVDVARMGDDKTIICTDIGNNFTFEEIFHHTTTAVGGRVIQAIKEVRPERVAVDADGVGAGVYDFVKEAQDNGIKDSSGKKINFELHEIHSGESPIDLYQTEEFNNLRSQMYWMIRQDIRNMNLQQDDDLAEELTTTSYHLDSRGKICLEAKDKIKTKIGRSPDKSDALAYTNFLKYIKAPTFSAKIY